ncbi:transposase [bacterium]|nr:transposase [bacterium]MBU1880805.1 transposase [bacterium]
MQIYHIVWVTHNSRVSPRMIEYEVIIRQRRVAKGLQPLVEPVWLEEWQEIEITEYIVQIAEEDKLHVLAYNICGDHIHIIIACTETERSNIVRKLKGRTTQYYKKRHNIDEKLHLWAQKYSWTLIEDEDQLNKAIYYIKNNRLKHGLPENKKLQPLVTRIVTGMGNLMFDGVNKEL